ncbi:alpha/beta hydrolase [Hoeflea prorocentri]|uniref:Alpha/beta hydrolase fold domain-containing protein n=1 Tax=Hoeflea prorocentri TaxID=1922333 RepID=A0A9X3UKZ8_9HYPH|nr:alpha/beta hydrolase fold domain-containing protein [Hoeflea prorocentri]MCY6382569.1 alpha/beta hydrolase fold domain-containing protein [Hoeflea prorocentri]MDA5400369.1 alpha/beta hydrolase fold domain-containing protein [Hoeflea prorocentri]
MAQVKFSGPLPLSLASFMTLNRIAIGVMARHLIGRRIAPDWDWQTEIGIRFWRHQFTKAMNHKDIGQGRAIYDSLQTETDDIYPVQTRDCDRPKGRWFYPDGITSDAVLLYLHGGGYTFNGPNSDRFAAMLAHHAGARLFMPLYRLTPDHPHPAQAEDALAAWRFVGKHAPAEKTVVIGDSAGGHMALTLLQSLKQERLAQPALCIALCPWTDIGARGRSLTDNNRYDLVQGWMALRFGEWLDPEGRYGREALSPISHDYAGLAPIYMQAGGREMLRDMIIDFAEVQAGNGADIMLDIWDDMPHDFQAYGSTKASSAKALARIRDAVHGHVDGGKLLATLPEITRTAHGCFDRGSGL